MCNAYVESRKWICFTILPPNYRRSYLKKKQGNIKSTQNIARHIMSWFESNRSHKSQYNKQNNCNNKSKRINVERGEAKNIFSVNKHVIKVIYSIINKDA